MSLFRRDINVVSIQEPDIYNYTKVENVVEFPDEIKKSYEDYSTLNREKVKEIEEKERIEGLAIAEERYNDHMREIFTHEECKKLFNLWNIAKKCLKNKDFSLDVLGEMRAVLNITTSNTHLIFKIIPHMRDTLRLFLNPHIDWKWFTGEDRNGSFFSCNLNKNVVLSFGYYIDQIGNCYSFIFNLSSLN